jgi:hypothetical protein
MKTLRPFYSTAALVALGSLFFTSCKSVYQPNAINTPLLNNAGEIRATVDPQNVQLAYAITDHAGVMLNGFYVKENSENNAIKGTGGLVEVGFGYFTRVRPFIFETYIGGGLGSVQFNETRVDDNNQTNVYRFEAQGMRFFVQPSFGLGTRFFDVAITPRFVLGKYSSVSTNYSTDDQIDGRFYQIDRPLWSFIEPAITIRGGYQWIKLQAQFGLSQKLNSEPLSYKDSFVNVGISFNLFRNYDE